MIDRTDANRALARAIAHKESGNDHQAAESARQLVTMLQCADILRSDDEPGALIYTLDGPDLARLMEELNPDAFELRLNVTDEGVKYSVNGRMWTLPKGRTTPVS